MISSILLTAMAADIVSTDKLSLYLGETCTNAVLGTVTPLEPGSCIEIGQAQSYFLTKDDDIVYNIYSGGSCASTKVKLRSQDAAPPSAMASPAS